MDEKMREFSKKPDKGTYINKRDIIIVNKYNQLSPRYVPTRLAVTNIRFIKEASQEERYLQIDAGQAAKNLFDRAEKEYILLFGVSAYRSYKSQDEMYQKAVKIGGETLKLMVKPGFSEHQLGLALDVSSPSVGYRLTANFARTKEGIWLSNNAHKYGFIIRYPYGKEQITGSKYKPWHLRYVGMEAASEIFHSNLSLEEYL